MIKLIKLTDSEKRIMGIIWKSAPIKAGDIVEEHSKLYTSAYTTVLKIVTILERKGFISYKTVGRNHLYFPTVTEKDYKNYLVDQLLLKYFDNSPKVFLTYLLTVFDFSKDLSCNK